LAHEKQAAIRAAKPRKKYMNELALFAGAGGGILGGLLCGFRTVCAVEINTYAASVLVQRQNDGFLKPFPVWDDVRSFDGKPWRNFVDVVSGGFPCQDISCAGKGAGIDGERSGLWKEMLRIIGEIRPKFAFVENSPILTVRGIERVLGDLAEMGFNAEYGTISAAVAGAPDIRERIWILAYPMQNRFNLASGEQPGGNVEERNFFPRWWGKLKTARLVDGVPPILDIEPQAKAIIGRVDDGLADQVDRLAAIGNGQVPAVVRLAWNTLTERAASMPQENGPKR
jgi:DNA (cytosine-5)-methyltransferase 1